MIKKVLNNKTYFNLRTPSKNNDDDGELELFKIGHVGNDEYYLYNDHGEGIAVATLNTIQMMELFFTGTLKIGRYNLTTQ